MASFFTGVFMEGGRLPLSLGMISRYLRFPEFWTCDDPAGVCCDPPDEDDPPDGLVAGGGVFETPDPLGGFRVVPGVEGT